MQEGIINKDVSDVEIKSETLKAEMPAPQFNPVTFLTQALKDSGYPDPEGWTQNIDPRAETAEEEKDRIFFANRALRLYIAEQPVKDNITPRMLLADGIDSKKWVAIMEQGVIPWLNKQFDPKTGKRIKPEEPKAEAPVQPMWKEWTGGPLNLSEEDKAQIRDFLVNDTNPEITIGDRTYLRINRQGATCLEWQYASDLSTSYTLRYEDYVAGGPDPVANSENLAPADSSVAVFAADAAPVIDDARPSSSEA